MATKRPTIADVARIAGVSKSTVSRVLNNRTHYMRAETQQRVVQAMDELHYRPSSVARSLVSKRTLTVGLVISDIGNPFYCGVIHGVEDVAMASGYDVFLCNTSYDLTQGLTCIKSLADKNVDGVMLMLSGISDELVLELARHRIPAVALEWPLDLVDGIVGVVGADFETGVHAAADHLIDLGHTRLAQVSGPLYLRTARMRRDFFLDRVAARGLDPAQVTVVEGNFCIDGGRRALAELLSQDERPTAVFCGNDLTALGVLWAARDYGLHVPEDLSIVGFDDVELASQISPSLTTVALPQHETGKTAMRMLLDLISLSQEPQSGPVFHRTIPTRLIVRQSTTKPRHNISVPKEEVLAYEPL